MKGCSSQRGSVPWYVPIVHIEVEIREEGRRMVHTFDPPTALYNINLPPERWLAQQTHYYSIPSDIVSRNLSADPQ